MYSRLGCLTFVSFLLVAFTHAWAADRQRGARPEGIRVAAETGSPRLVIDLATIAAGKLVITGRTAARNIPVAIKGTRFRTRSDARRRFRFSVDYRTPDCRITLTTNTGELELMIGECGPAGPPGLGVFADVVRSDRTCAADGDYERSGSDMICRIACGADQVGLFAWVEKRSEPGGAILIGSGTSLAYDSGYAIKMTVTSEEAKRVSIHLAIYCSPRRP